MLRARRGGGAWRSYIQHQKSKLSKAAAEPHLLEQIRAVDIGRQAQVAKQMEEAMHRRTGGMRSTLGGETVLCIGARLGGEVRAFKSLGALAVGIDLNPGPDSLDVLVGDMEDVPFPARTFGLVYSNVVSAANPPSALPRTPDLP
eukprot:699695-Prymnesium_polylepis.1